MSCIQNYQTMTHKSNTDTEKRRGKTTALCDKFLESNLRRGEAKVIRREFAESRELGNQKLRGNWREQGKEEKTNEIGTR